MYVAVSNRIITCNQSVLEHGVKQMEQLWTMILGNSRPLDTFREHMYVYRSITGKGPTLKGVSRSSWNPLEDRPEARGESLSERFKGSGRRPLSPLRAGVPSFLEAETSPLCARSLLFRSPSAPT